MRSLRPESCAALPFAQRHAGEAVHIGTDSAAVMAVATGQHQVRVRPAARIGLPMVADRRSHGSPEVGRWEGSLPSTTVTCTSGSPMVRSKLADGFDASPQEITRLLMPARFLVRQHVVRLRAGQTGQGAGSAHQGVELTALFANQVQRTEAPEVGKKSALYTNRGMPSIRPNSSRAGGVSTKGMG